MDLLAIRQALAAVVEQATDICYPFPLPSPAAPCAVIDLEPGQIIDYLLAFRQGQVEIHLRIILLAALADDEGTAKIASWLSTGNSESVPDILRVDKTLGGLVGDLIVRRAENASWIEIPPNSGTWFASAEIAVDLYLPQ